MTRSRKFEIEKLGPAVLELAEIMPPFPFAVLQTTDQKIVQVLNKQYYYPASSHP